MGRLIIDLTEFNEWSGHLTGIQRVVFGLANSLRSGDPEVRYVAFDVRRGVFNEAAIEPIRAALLAEESAAQRAAAAGRSPQNLKRSIRSRAHSFVSALSRRMPTGLKTRVKRSLQSLNRRAAAIGRPSGGKSAERFDFRSDDVFLSAGRAWNERTYLAAVEELAAEAQPRIAFIVYDLIPVLLSHTFPTNLDERYTRYLEYVLRRADVLLAISESTKRDLVQFASGIGLDQLPEIQTLRLGDDIVHRVPTSRPTFVTEGEPFIICVGTVEARKNHWQIYYAYKLASERGLELPKVYFIGRPGWLTSDLIYFLENDQDVADKIILMKSVSDDDLAWLYSHALFSVFPSQYEGWGLPVAESIAYGTPCITTAVASLPEVGQQLVDYVSPYDTNQLLQEMLKYSDPAFAAKKRAEIQSAYVPHTWRQALVSILPLVR